jgi:hypothetical protein
MTMYNRSPQADVRVLRIADGPDEVHNRTIAKLELQRFERDAGN